MEIDKLKLGSCWCGTTHLGPVDIVIENDKITDVMVKIHASSFSPDVEIK